MSAGGAGFKPLGYPIHKLTGDGHGMAYRVGAEITGKEFVAPIGAVGKRAGWPPRYFTHTHRPSAVMSGFWRGRGTRSLRTYVNAEGDEVQRRAVLAWHGWQDAPAEAHAGRAPLFTIGPNGQKIQTEGGAANFGGRHGHATDGILPINKQCATSVQGLYAAGDSCGMMFVGATYSGFGFATALASVTGAKAGTAAAEYALQEETLLVDEPEQARVKQIAHAPLKRQGGFSPRWVTQILQNLMLPYFVMYVKHAKRLQSTLTMI